MSTRLPSRNGLLALALAALGVVAVRDAPAHAPGTDALEQGSERLGAVGALASALPTVGRLQYGGGGDWYANPSSLPNLLEAIRARTGIPVGPREEVVAPLDPALFDFPLIHMTGHGNVVFNADEQAALRRYLEGGGFLHADDNYGMDEAFRREMERLYPDRPLVELPPDHPIFSAFYEFPEGLPKIHEHDALPPQAFGIFHEGRLIVLYTYETDLGNGWEDPEVHDNPQHVREEALRMGVNIFVYALSQRAP